MSLKSIILRQLEQRHGAEYAASKAKRLEGMTTCEVLFWSTHALDAQAQEELREALTVEKQDWQSAAKVLLKVNNI